MSRARKNDFNLKKKFSPKFSSFHGKILLFNLVDLATLPQSVTPSGTVSAAVSSSDFPPHSDKVKLNLTKKIMESRDVPSPKKHFIFQDHSTVDANQNLTIQNIALRSTELQAKFFRFFSWSSQK
jgi:hypothetical protein